MSVFDWLTVGLGLAAGIVLSIMVAAIALPVLAEEISRLW